MSGSRDSTVIVRFLSASNKLRKLVIITKLGQHLNCKNDSFNLKINRNNYKCHVVPIASPNKAKNFERRWNGGQNKGKKSTYSATRGDGMDDKF